MFKFLAIVLTIALAAPTGAAAQVSGDVWRGFVEKVDVGTEMNVRLTDGTRFRAVLVGGRADAVLLQPKTRITVPVQAVPYNSIAALERRQHGGMGAAKAAAIGVGAGAATFLGILLVLFAAIDD
jgi:hypothetical protein